MFVFQPIGWKLENCAAPSSLSGQPPDHNTLRGAFSAARPSSRSSSPRVNDGSLVIPSHVCSHFGFACAHRHKSTLPPRVPSSVLVRSHRVDHCCRRSGLDLCFFCVPYFPEQTLSPPSFLCVTPALSLRSPPWCGLNTVWTGVLSYTLTSRLVVCCFTAVSQREKMQRPPAGGLLSWSCVL